MARLSRLSPPAGQALPRFLALYVALQPLLDVLTSLATQAEISLTAGTVVRTLFVGFAFLYTVFCGPFPGRKALLSYLGLLTGYLAVFGLWSLVRGGMSACIVNLSEALKTFYFPYTAAFLYAIYRQKRWIVPDWAVAAAGLGYAGVILLACITGTSFYSYNAGYGYSGWFYAANDVSIVIMLTAPWFLPALPQAGCSQTPQCLGVDWYGCRVRSALVQRRFFRYQAGVSGDLAVSSCSLSVVCSPPAFDAAGRCRPVFGCCAGAVRPAVRPVPGLSPEPLCAGCLRSHVRRGPGGLRKKPGHSRCGGQGPAKANARLEQAAKGTWLGDLIETQPVVKKLNWLLSRRLLIIAPSAEEYTRGGAWVTLFGLGYAQLSSYVRPVTHLIEMEGVALLLRHGLVGFLLYYVPFLAAAAALLLQFFRRLKTRWQISPTAPSFSAP